MKKTFKIIGIVLIVLTVIVGLFIYNGNKRYQKSKIAQENADYIITNLDNENVIKEFPEVNFPDRQQLMGIIGGLKENCDWKNRDGKFVDFFTMTEVGGINSIAYIYEYYLTCDSLRFILIYNLDKDKPELFKLNIEPLETENPMIIFPEKQLKNRK
jgi:hypothetical protein